MPVREVLEREAVMSFWTDLTSAAVKVGEQAGSAYVAKELGNAGVVGPTPAPAAAPVTTPAQPWLIPAIIGGVLLLVGVVFFASKK
jgi:hypothetical protein